MRVADLIAKSPCDGLLPVSAGPVTLSEVDPGVITSLSPHRGKGALASEILKVTHGMAFPAPGRSTGKAGARAIWSGQGQAFLVGPEPDAVLAQTCAMSDQSDGWAVMRLDGFGAEAVLARLCPLDLRPGRFKRGHTARSMLGHMNVSLTKTGAQTFEIMVFRSMAHTAVHELIRAMKSVAAQS